MNINQHFLVRDNTLTCCDLMLFGLFVRNTSTSYLRNFLMQFFCWSSQFQSTRNEKVGCRPFFYYFAFFFFFFFSLPPFLSVTIILCFEPKISFFFFFFFFFFYRSQGSHTPGEAYGVDSATISSESLCARSTQTHHARSRQ